MGHAAKLAPIAGILSLCLMLSSFGVSGALAAAALPQAATGSFATLVYGTDSCVGTQACDGAVGPIGDNSCIGNFSCLNATGSIGAGSCVGTGACNGATGTVGANSCNDQAACGLTTSITSANVGDNSCNGITACTGATGGSIGANSCNGHGGQLACFLSTANVGDNSCNGEQTCIYQATALGDCVRNLPGFAPAACPQADGRIRKGTGSFVGNNVYNTTGTSQSKTGAAARGKTITFGIEAQNDGTSGAFHVAASGTASSMYAVTYFRGTNNITAAVVAGTYTTPVLAHGARFLIKAVVKVKSTAIVASSVTRLVTITSVGDASNKDVVQFTGKRS